MVGITKRRVQAGRRDDFEGGSAGSKAARMGESTEEVQQKLRRHFNDTAFLQGQWRVRGVGIVDTFRGVLCWGAVVDRPTG